MQIRLFHRRWLLFEYIVSKPFIIVTLRCDLRQNLGSSVIALLNSHIVVSLSHEKT